MIATMKQAADMVRFLGKTLPNLYEIILFDMTKKELPIVASSKNLPRYGKENRRLLRALKEHPQLLSRDMIMDQTLVASGDQLTKCSIYFIKKEQEDTEQTAADNIGAFCINLACNELVSMQGFLFDLLNFQPHVLYDENREGEEHAQEEQSQSEISWEKDVITLDTIGAVVAASGVAPERLSQSEKMTMLIDMYDAGVFDLKGAVARAARELALSEQSVYRYLSKIKRAGE